MSTDAALGSAETSLAGPPPVPSGDFWDKYYASVVTEDDVPKDSIYSEKQQRLLTEPLYSCWPGPGEYRSFFAFAYVGVFYSTELPPIVPDTFLSTDVKLPADIWTKKNRSYFVWRYGKPPDVAIEIVSNKEGEELGRKVDIYARIGVPYYVVWDPEHHLGEEPLHVFALHAGVYQRQSAAWFPRVNLGLKIWSGVYEEWDFDWIRWCDEAGRLIPTGAEAKQSADQRTEQADQRADQANQRAEQAEQELAKARQRAEKLAAIMRSQGLQPPENGQ
jgi:Uma2 family endonuclease